MGIVSGDPLLVTLLFLIPDSSELVYKLKHEGLHISLHNCELSSYQLYKKLILSCRNRHFSYQLIWILFKRKNKPLLAENWVVNFKHHFKIQTTVISFITFLRGFFVLYLFMVSCSGNTDMCHLQYFAYANKFLDDFMHKWALSHL